MKETEVYKFIYQYYQIMKEKLAKSKKRIFLGFLIILLFFIGFLSGYIYINLSKAIFRKDSTSETSSLPIVTPAEDATDIYNVLLLGYGGPGHDGGTLSDAIVVANVDPINNKVALITIPRDVWVLLPVRSDLMQHYKINHAFAIGSSDRLYPLKEPKYKGEAGGSEMAKYAVSKVIGMPIKYFIAVSFEGFVEAIDILDGVNVNVPVTFDDYFYPVKGLENETCGKTSAEIAEYHSKYSGFQLEKQFECRYEHIHYDQGLNQMSGEEALKFIRSRHSEQHGGDFARGERQQVVLLAAKDKLLSTFSIKKANDLLKNFSRVISTDIDEHAIAEIIQTHGEFSEYSIKKINISEENVLQSSTSADGQFILIPKAGIDNFEKVQEFVLTNL